jgi:hypothetical protein
MKTDGDALVAWAGQYVAAYEAQSSGLVAEERYQQKVYRFQQSTVVTGWVTGNNGREPLTNVKGEWVLAEQRDLRSDYLLVQAPGMEHWLPFRDVFEVDGKKVRDHDTRLQKLFLEAPSTAVQRAREILAESARYNIGFVDRNLNLPTFALAFLAPSNQRRFAFRKRGESVVAGVRTWELAYREQASPTFVRNGAQDLPAEGVVWIDPLVGRVVQTLMRIKLDQATLEITVTYGPNAKAGGVWVPVEMKEAYTGVERKLECSATYSNIRRFQVTTDVQIPKH